MSVAPGEMSAPYNRISCSAYDVLEAAAVRRHPLECHMVDGTVITATILDVFARGPVEYCTIADESGTTLEPIRLDAIAFIIDTKTRTRYATSSC